MSEILKYKTPLELLKLHGEILQELKRQGVVKTRNQPIADYSKWLVRTRLNLKEVKNPNEKYDAYDNSGIKYLVRSRQVIGDNLALFSVIRKIEERNFDYVVVITYDEEYKIADAYKIPIDILIKEVDYNDYQNGYIIKLRDLDLNDKRITDVKSILE